MDNYTVYHLHTTDTNAGGYYDSCTSYKDYIKLAKKNNMKAIAFSNHGSIYDWVRKKQDCDKAGIKYIHGVELYLCTKLELNERGFHIGLYAKNFDGVKELNTLMSKATLKGKLDDNTDRHFYYNPRISLKELMNTSNNIIITTACLASLLWRASVNPNKLKNDIENINNQIIHIQENFDEKSRDEQSELTRVYLNELNKQKNKNEEWLCNLQYYSKCKNELLEWLSKNNHRCFLEIQYHNHINQKEYNNLLYKWSKEYNIPLIAGTDTHSSTKYKAECRKILQKSNNSFYGDEDAFDLTWKTYDELVAEFKNQNTLPEDVFLKAIENTNKFADMCEDFELDKSFKYPNLYGKNAIDKWAKTILSKFKYKCDNNIIDITKLKEYKENIQIEFDAMKSQGMESFMLFMSELADYCNENNIPYGPCRGSVGGSIIAYITDITDVDPIKWNTVFSRFCNADRISLADIDMDFAPSDRKKVYKFIIDKFGVDKVSYIAQFGTLKDRGTIDVLARGLDYKDLNVVKNIKNKFEEYFGEFSKIIQEEVNLEELENIEARSVDFDYIDIYINRIRNNDAIVAIKNLKQKFENLKLQNQDIFYYFDGIKGIIVSKGNHPAGMIGSPITIKDSLGVFYKDGDENFPVATCAMKAVDSLNFVKFDILGLKTIGVIKDTFKYIDSKYLKSHEINWNDENVWNDMMISNVGVFQFEGNYAFDLLKKFKPKYINDMSLVNAALRPSGKSYRDRLITKEINKNPSEQIDDLLKDNYGYLVYQEDTIKFLTDICGFSGSLADSTRRCIGKKDIEGLREQLPKILDGYCKKSNKPRSVAEEEAKQFLKIIDDSSEYQFGYNHSTGYSMIGYIAAMLRYYYPIEFITSYLNNASNTDDIVMGTILAGQKDIKIENIKFRKSIDKYTFDKQQRTIYKGIESIKFCNSKIALELYNLRDKKYNNFVELLIDIKQKTSTDSRQLEILTVLNYFSEFGKNKRLLQQIELFNNIYGKKPTGRVQINKNKDLEKFNISEEIVEKYSGKKTVSLYKELDLIGLINELSEKIENKQMNIKEQLQKEFEYLEYFVTTVPIAKGYYYVKEMKTYSDKAKPYLLLYEIATGNEVRAKVTDAEDFLMKPFNEGCVLETKLKEQGNYKGVNKEIKILKKWKVY